MTDGEPIAFSRTRKLFVVSEGGAVAKRAAKLAEQSAEPKRSVILPSASHSIFSHSTEQFVLSEAIVDMLR